jgi:integrase
VHWPTSAQLGALLEASLDTVWEVPILLAAVTGARRAEVLGISWEDFDLEGAQSSSVAVSSRFATSTEEPWSSLP